MSVCRRQKKNVKGLLFRKTTDFKRCVPAPPVRAATVPTPVRTRIRRAYIACTQIARAPATPPVSSLRTTRTLALTHRAAHTAHRAVRTVPHARTVPRACRSPAARLARIARVHIRRAHIVRARRTHPAVPARSPHAPCCLPSTLTPRPHRPCPHPAAPAPACTHRPLPRRRSSTVSPVPTAHTSSASARLPAEALKQ